MRKTYMPRVDQITKMEAAMQALSDEQLQAKTGELKAKVAGGTSLDSLLPEAFAVRPQQIEYRCVCLCPCCLARLGGARGFHINLR